MKKTEHTDNNAHAGERLAEVKLRFAQRLSWDDLSSEACAPLIELARNEDLFGRGLRTSAIFEGDVTSAAVLARTQHGAARLVARQPLVVCGLPLIRHVLAAYSSELTLELYRNEGDDCQTGEVIGRVTGPISELLSAERVVLNFLQHLSGIATQTQRYVSALGNSSIQLVDTRKTTPGYRLLEKIAVATGGAWNHRTGLFDRILIKDNHLAAGSAGRGNALADAVRRARSKAEELSAQDPMIVECEIDCIEQIDPVLQAGADVLMLDNFSTPMLIDALRHIDGRALTEASGGITRERLPELAPLPLDFISTGALVHRAIWVDIGLDWEAHA